jgi:cation:H+ antiporter
MIWLWTQFLLCAGVIVGAGVFLVKFGDVIAERTGLGRLWAGAILVATATSLPELFTGVSSVLIFDAPDLAVGTLLGSCVVNLLILVALDALSGRKSFFDGVNPAYIVETAFALVLLAIVALGLFLSEELRAFPWVWPGSLLVPLVYVVAVRVTMREGRYPPFVQDLETYHGSDAGPSKPEHLPTLKRAIAGYAAAATLVIAASLWLPGVAEGIAEGTGIGTTVVGGVLLALTTSLPEIVTTVAAFCIGAADMAFSNVIGSNLFNVVVLAVDDFLYVGGPITSHASPAQLATAIIAMGMTGTVIAALAVRKQRKLLGFSWTSIVLVAGFVLNVVCISMLQ